MQIGIDTYSYHRLLGELRPGERPPARRWSHREIMSEMLAAGAEALSVETVFLPPASAAVGHALTAEAAGRELILSWGHPHGLRWGGDARAAADLAAWVTVAADIGVTCVRFVAAHPTLVAGARLPDGTLRAEVRRSLAERIAGLVAIAEDHGIVLCVENHADLTVAEIERLLDAAPPLAVCLDTVNALRVGDDPVDAVRRLGDRIRIVHVKDTRRSPRTCRLGDGLIDLGAVLTPLLAHKGVVACVELADLESATVDEVSVVRDCVRWLKDWRLTNENREG